MDSRPDNTVLDTIQDHTGKDAFLETELVIREDSDDHQAETKGEILTPLLNSAPETSARAPEVTNDAQGSEFDPKNKPCRQNSFDRPSQEKRAPLFTVSFADSRNMSAPQLPVQHEPESVFQTKTAPEIRPALKGALKKPSFKLGNEERHESTESYSTEVLPFVESNNNNNGNVYGYDVDGNSSIGSPRRDSYVRMLSKDSDSVFSAEEDSYPGSKNSSCTIDAPLRNGLFMILSGIYGMIIIVLGGVLPIAEIFEGPEDTYYIEGYYVFLYGVSIGFMGYVYLYLLRSKHPDSGRSWLPGWLLTSGSQASAVASPSPARRHRRRIAIDLRKHKQTGSFYLRLGAVGFGIGSMIHSGLQFGEYFQVSEGPSPCSGPLQAVKPITHLMFTFVQLYFIFLNAKMCIYKFQTVARFGLMHMIGTNMCVWFRNIIVETLHEIHQHERAAHHVTHDVTTTLQTPHYVQYAETHDINKSGHSIHHRAVHPEPTASPNHSVYITATNGESSTYHLPEISCHFNDVMSRVVEQAGPYLYPCTIEYSLICAGILYVMWRNVGKDHSRHLPPAVDGEIGLYRHRMSVDCSNSHRGLFMGIFLFVFAVISIIAFFVLVQKDNMAYTAVIFVNLCEIITYTLGIAATIIAFHQMRPLSYVMRGGNLEDNLILISLMGVYVFAIFSIIAATDDREIKGGLFFVFADLLLMIQSTLQTIFMVCGMRMYATKSVHERKKPGREMVTFLLVTNIAMWGMTTFETQRAEHNPIQLHFYGYLSWSILTHISVPLAIFYRFHSTVCLSNIWKQAWKKRTTLL